MKNTAETPKRRPASNLFRVFSFNFLLMSILVPILVPKSVPPARIAARRKSVLARAVWITNPEPASIATAKSETGLAKRTGMAKKASSKGIKITPPPIPKRLETMPAKKHAA